MKELPEKIEALETEQAEIHKKLADPSLYKGENASQVPQLKDRLQAIEVELEEALVRWEELEQIPE